MDGIDEMGSNSLSRSVVLGIALVFSILVGVTVVNRSNAADSASERFWSIPRLRAQEAESFDTLQEMTRSADVVVVGRIVAVAPSRVLTAKPPSDAPIRDPDAWFAGYASVELAVDWASPAGSVGTFEVFLSTEAKYKEFLSAQLPVERSVFFLRSKEVAALAAGWSPDAAASERPYFMLVNSEQGAIHEVDGLASVSDEADALSASVNGKTFEAIVAEVIGLRE